MLGEQFSIENEVLGLVLSTKFSGDSIAIWMRHSDSNTIATLKGDLRRIVLIDENTMKLDHEIFQEVLSQPKTHY